MVNNSENELKKLTQLEKFFLCFFFFFFNKKKVKFIDYSSSIEKRRGKKHKVPNFLIQLSILFYVNCKQSHTD